MVGCGSGSRFGDGEEGGIERLVSLDDAGAAVPATVGAKAARLAAARAAGLPVPPGYVVPVAQCAAALRRGMAALAEAGTGGARLAVMEAELGSDLIAELAAAGEELGPPLVVRSSSPVESDPAWAGAFTSYLELGADELPVAVRGCWASLFAPEALERCEQAGTSPESLALAALVQPEVRPEAGGTAVVDRDGNATVMAVQGAPATLLQGWEPGDRAVVAPTGDVQGDDAAERFGATLLGAVAALARDVRARLGEDHIEWASAEGRVVLLQVMRRAGGETASPPQLLHPAPAEVLTSPACVRVARLVRRFPGEIGDALVLPWAVAATELPSPAREPSPQPAADPLAALHEARARARELTARAWNLPGGRAGEAAAAAFAALRGSTAVTAAEQLTSLRPVDIHEGAAIVAAIDAVGARLAADGILAAPGEVWRESVAGVEELAAAGRARARPSAQARPDRWEAFVFSVVVAAGATATGVASSPGAGAGVACPVAEGGELPRLAPREVLVADRPLPQLSSLLWNAAGLVTTGGGPAAHLMEVARSLNVPAVAGCALEALLADGEAPAIVAVDGNSGSVAALPL